VNSNKQITNKTKECSEHYALSGRSWVHWWCNGYVVLALSVVDRGFIGGVMVMSCSH
jgi:hypothetical protein